MSPGLAAVYQDRLAAHRSAHARLERLDARFAHARIGVFALAIATAFIAWRAAVTPWVLLAPGAAFLLLIVRHDRTIRARDAAPLAIAYYERGLARIEDRWIGTGELGTRFPRLDTLFLTLPVSWRGTIAQCVGRLHRLDDGKREVQVYDYADLNGHAGAYVRSPLPRL